MNDQLPRLAFIGDTLVERSRGGALLLYRLLADYPPDRLLIIQSTDWRMGPEYLLPGVEYRRFAYRTPRLIRNKLNPFWPLMFHLAMKFKRRSVVRKVQDFEPQIILTVADAFLWTAAVAAARDLNIPLALIVHDDWPSMMYLMTTYRRGPIMRILRTYYDWEFGREFGKATERLCICPGMVEHYEKAYGIKGSVLYPNRGEDSPKSSVRTRKSPSKEPVIAFAGTLHTRGVIQLLRSTAELLLPAQGRLDLYAPEPLDLTDIGLNLPNVRKAGFLPPAEVANQVGETAHALLLPASFDPDEQTVVTTLFPSKLVDYTAMGLPIIIWGPSYSSAARWGLENPTAALTFTTPDVEPIRCSIIQIAQQPEYAAALAKGAVTAGDRDFDLQQARAALYQRLQDAVQKPHFRSAEFAANQVAG